MYVFYTRSQVRRLGGEGGAGPASGMHLKSKGSNCRTTRRCTLHTCLPACPPAFPPACLPACLPAYISASLTCSTGSLAGKRFHVDAQHLQPAPPSAGAQGQGRAGPLCLHGRPGLCDGGHCGGDGVAREPGKGAMLVCSLTGIVTRADCCHTRSCRLSALAVPVGSCACPPCSCPFAGVVLR